MVLSMTIFFCSCSYEHMLNPDRNCTFIIKVFPALCILPEGCFSLAAVPLLLSHPQWLHFVELFCGEEFRETQPFPCVLRLAAI